MATSLSADEARLIALWRQGFVGPIGAVTASRVQRLGAAARVGLVGDMLSHLGAVQLDTISVLARSHELVAYARLGAIGREAVDEAYWGRGSNGLHDAMTPGLAPLTPRPRAFEYWSHAACLLPMESWPLFAFRRRHYARKGVRWHEVTSQAVAEVLAQLHAEGPLTTTHIGGAKRGGQWWDWSDAKVAIEWLLDIGTVVVTRRVGWRREYDLAERAVPAVLREQAGWSDEDGIVGPADEDCVRELVRQSARVMGVGTADDLADVHRLVKRDVARHAEGAGLVPVSVEGWQQGGYATREALDWLATNPRAVVRTTLLSPFDSLVWHRPRTERIFGMTHRLEAYTPAHKRVHGYFAMPVLHQGRLVAQVDPKRNGDVLEARRVTFEASALRRDGSPTPAAVRGTSLALHEAARWVGAAEVSIGEVVPPAADAALRDAIASGG